MAGRRKSAFGAINQVFRKDRDIRELRENDKTDAVQSTTSAQGEARTVQSLDMRSATSVSTFSFHPLQSQPSTTEATVAAGTCHHEKFQESFFRLPAELVVDILCYLDKDSMVALRSACRRSYNLVQFHQSPIVRSLVKQDSTFKSAAVLYPPPPAPELATWGYIYQLSHRLAVVHRLSQQIASFIVQKVYRKTIEEFADQYENMINNMEPLLLHIFHFLEQYRAALIDSVKIRTQECDEVNQHIRCREHLQEEMKILEQYDIKILSRTDAMYKVLCMIVVRKLRPPSYAGKFERALRGWSREPAREEDIVKLLVLGGLEEVKNILDFYNYAARRNALDDYIARTFPTEEMRKASRRFFPRWSKRQFPKLGAPSSTTDRLSKTQSFPGSSTACASLPKITCSVVSRLDYDTAVEIASYLPKLSDLWRESSLQILREREIIDISNDFPTNRQFMRWAMIKEPDEEIRASLDSDDDDSSTDEDGDSDSDGEGEGEGGVGH